MIKDSLYTAFISQINYTNFIEGITNKVEGKTDFELLQAIYTGFLYTMLFEDYFSVSGDTVSTDLTDSFVEDLIDTIATKTPFGYTFGEEGVNLGYNSKEKALYKLKCKIAHGDFYVEDGNIIFQEKGIKGIINLSKFELFLTKLEDNGNSNKKYKPEDRLIYINKNSNNYPITKNNIDKVAKKIYQVRINNKPLPLHIRNDQYVKIVEQIIERNKRYINNNPNLPIDKYKQVFDGCSELSKKEAGIDLNYTIVPICDLPEYQEIKDKFLTKINNLTYNYGEIDSNTKISLLGHTVYGIENENRIAIRKSILLNINILNYLNKNSNLNRDDMVNKIGLDIGRFIVTELEDIITMSYLVGFYSLFQYGLENSLTRSNERELYEIYTGSKLNFAELNVDSLESNTRVNEMGILKQEYSKDKKKNVKGLERKYLSLASAYENLVNEKGIDVASKLKEKMDDAQLEYDQARIELVNDVNNYINFASNFDFARYNRNLDIIYHIRNAISHGNIRIVKYGHSMMDTVIRIIDKSEGRTGYIVYDKELTIGEFVRIFNGTNTQILHDFLASHTENNELVEEDYCEKVFRRVTKI